MKLYAIAAGLNGAVCQSLYGHHYFCHIHESYPGQEKTSTCDHRSVKKTEMSHQIGWFGYRRVTGVTENSLMTLLIILLCVCVFNSVIKKWIITLEPLG